MANAKKRKKLSAKQASILWGIIVIMYLIYASVKVTTRTFTGIDATCKLIIGIIIETIVVSIVLPIMLNLTGRKAEEKYNEVKSRITKCLSSSEFTQVYYIKENEDAITAIFRNISENRRCKFFAQITSDEVIKLVVRDRYGKEIYDTEIEDFYLFDSNFKFEK